MNKKDFLKQIKSNLKDFNNEEKNKIIEYYDELINDYIDEGMTEENAISSLGDINTIISSLKADLVIERSNSEKTNSLKNFLIILGVCSTPVLIPLGIGFFILFFSLAFSLLVVFVSFVGSAGVVLFSSFFTVVEMIINGTDIGTILVVFGVQLIVASTLGLLAKTILNIGKKTLNFINKQFGKLVKQKSKKEVRFNA